MPPVDPMVLQLRPHIIRAGVWAGISCALTLILAALIVGTVHTMFF